MTTNNHSDDRLLEQQLELAASDQPLDTDQQNSETQKLRQGWHVLQSALESSHDQPPPLNVEAMWEFAQREEVAAGESELSSRGERRGERGGVRHEVAGTAAEKTAREGSQWGLLWLVATAATLAIVALGLWKLVDSSGESNVPEIVVDEQPLPIEEPASMPYLPQPEMQEQLVQQQPPAEVEPTEESVSQPAAVPSQPTDAYAWDDDFDDSIASAQSSAYDIRYGWRNTSESYRYISTRFESIDDSLSDDSL